jgi:hypothetical protein
LHFEELAENFYRWYVWIYNNAKRTVEVWSYQDYSESFVFGVTGERIE